MANQCVRPALHPPLPQSSLFSLAASVTLEGSDAAAAAAGGAGVQDCAAWGGIWRIRPDRRPAECGRTRVHVVPTQLPYHLPWPPTVQRVARAARAAATRAPRWCCSCCWPAWSSRRPTWPTCSAALTLTEVSDKRNRCYNAACRACLCLQPGEAFSTRAPNSSLGRSLQLLVSLPTTSNPTLTTCGPIAALQAWARCSCPTRAPSTTCCACCWPRCRCVPALGGFAC